MSKLGELPQSTQGWIQIHGRKIALVTTQMEAGTRELVAALSVAGAAMSLLCSGARSRRPQHRVPPPQLPDALVDAYLARLGLARPVAPTVEALSTLVEHHVDRVAYEDLDIHLGRPPSSLEPEHTAARVALDGRGGYCFQLGGAFASLLASLGFDVSMHRATVRNALSDVGAGPPVESSPEALEELNHLAVVVHFQTNGSDHDASEELYLADVGLGDGPCRAVPLIEGRYDEASFEYKVEATASGWRFVHDRSGSFGYFDLVMEPEVGVGAFERAHQRLSTDPDSSFVKTATVQRRTADTVIVVKRCVLTRTGAGGSGEARGLLEDEEAWYDCLRDTFGLTGFERSSSSSSSAAAQSSGGGVASSGDSSTAGTAGSGARVGAAEQAALFRRVLADHTAHEAEREGEEQGAVASEARAVAGPVAGSTGFAAVRRGGATL